MNSKIVQKFIENSNCIYLFLVLANEELSRLSKLPYPVREKFNKKLPVMALEHIAEGNIPDYFVQEEEKPEGKMSDIIDE
ncbi:MAG: hypothetical protein J7J77_02415 [Candidatus Cloacimonetes bacterium]|nr:hypothetical protein [Candidatus Cloacimonadota bacterium]